MSERIYNEMFSYAGWRYCQSFPYFSMFSLISYIIFAIENNQDVESRVRNKGQLASDLALCQEPARKCISMSQPG